MDLFVLCSFSEGTSMALLEAAAAGVPVAVTAVGGNPEIVVDGVTGWIISSGSVEELTRAIQDCITDPAKRERFIAAGKGRFAQEFTLQRRIGGYRERYRSLLPGAGDRIAGTAP
ncbi:MAG: glycosyltransferase [Steroidobacteraceae bacterium]